MGGIAMGIPFIILYLWVHSLGFFYIPRSILSWQVFGIIISSLIMLVFGVVDDWKELSITTKFLTQIIATSLLIFYGIKTQIIFFSNFLNIIVTFIWIIGITNAFNHLDVMDGLAGGTALMVGFAFWTISILTGQMQTAVLSLILSGVVLGFLIYNFPPAKVYMGNCGSHFLGFVLAAIALLISYAPLERKIALLSPILILGLPIFDTAFLILIRIAKGKSAFKKSEDHLALRFLKIGHSKNKALLFMLSLALLFSVCGILLTQVSNALGLAIVVFVLSVNLVLTTKMSRVKVGS